MARWIGWCSTSGSGDDPTANQKLIDAYHSATSSDVVFMLVFFSYIFRSINGSSGSGRMISVNELPVSGRAMPLGRRPSTNRSTISNFDSGNESRSTTTSTVAAGRIKSVTNAEFAERPPQAYSRFDPLHCGPFSVPKVILLQAPEFLWLISNAKELQKRP